MAGKQEKASQYYAELVKVCAGSNSDRPELNRAKGWWRRSRDGEGGDAPRDSRQDAGATHKRFSVDSKVTSQPRLP